MDAHIVVGLGFGDEGKGRTVDYLCSQSKNPLVVRFSGGQQAGHCVMIGDKKHVHSNYGAGTLRGVPSYFSEHCCFYLNTMYEEYKVLKDKGVEPKLFIHPLAKVTTPYDVAYNRVMERLNCHGSCGLGIAATFKRHLNSGHKLYPIDLHYPKPLEVKLRRIRSYYEDLLEKMNYRYIAEFKKELVYNEEKFFELAKNPEKLFTIADYDLCQEYKTLIFEGSQGIMLDMDHGIFPNVTYANTTSKNAMEICQKLKLFPEVWYVTRCYQTRHGAGWMSNYDPIELINNQEEINVYNQWQTNFRTAELDYDLLNYALQVDCIYSRNTAANIAVTCLDQRPGFSFDIDRLDISFEKILKFDSPKTEDLILSK